MTADLTMIQQTATTLFRPGTVAEIRILNTPRHGTVSGYFDALQPFVQAARQWSGKAPAVYATLNPCNPALLARAANRLKDRVQTTTSDGDIVHRCWFPLDFDPVRPADISSTDAEHDAALQRAADSTAWLHSRGWPAPVAADSGNGGHRLYAIDLPNDEASKTLLQRCLEALALYFSDSEVKLDVGVFNAGRIWKVYGTMACKGDNLPERPHRLAQLLDVPTPVEIVNRAQLEALAALVPEPPQTLARSGHQGRGSFDLDKWIADHGVPVVSRGAWGSGGSRWILNPCPWNSAHTNKSAFIVQLASGAIAAGCHHNGCSGHDWHALRELYEPGWQPFAPPAALYVGGSKNGAAPSEHPSTVTANTVPPALLEVSPPWPQLREEAYHGLAGAIVRTIEPQTESDPAALLVQLLVMVGNAIGRVPYFPVEADRHYLNLFACLVGATSKGRKGTSVGHPKRLMTAIDSAWGTRVMGGLSSGEGVIWNLRDPAYGHNKKGEEVCLDEGVEDKRLCILETEFARALAKTGQEGNVLSAVLRQAWDHGELRTLVSGRQKAPVAATNAHVSVIAHITMDEVRRLLTNTDAANGFGNRFLWACVRRSKLLPRGGKYPEQALKPLTDRLVATLFHARKVGQMQRTPDAETRWEAIYTALAEDQPRLLGAITARAEAQVLRLSCVYALLDETDTVDVPHLNAAYALWRYCEASARYIFGTILGDPLADDIIRMLRQMAPGGMTRTDINHALGRNYKSATLGQALDRLLREGHARCTVEKTSGRPVEWWFASTPVSVRTNELNEKSPPALTLNSFNSLVRHAEDEITGKCPHTQMGQENGQQVCLDCGELVVPPPLPWATAGIHGFNRKRIVVFDLWRDCQLSYADPTRWHGGVSLRYMR
jgi:Protein of unknown function (DUF3987)